MAVIQVKDTNKTFRLHKKLKQNLDISLNAIKRYEQDLVLVIDGKEGSGKSQFSRQIGYYCAQKLGTKFNINNAENIHNNVYSYIKASLDGNKYQVNILDESRKALNRKRSMGKTAVHFTNYLSECRDQQQVHIICVPAFHDLDEYVILWRVNFVIHMIKKYKYHEEIDDYRLTLGQYKLYANDKNLKQCYNNKYNYPKRYEAYAQNKNTEVLTKQGLKKYKDKKKDRRKKKYSKDDKKEEKHKQLREKVQIIRNLQRQFDFTLEEVSEVFNVTRPTLYNWMDREKQIRKEIM